MPAMRRGFTLSLLAGLGLAVGGCSVTTEPYEELDCTQFALNLPTTTDLTTTASGLQYRDVVVGPGETVTTGRRVTTFYAACTGAGQLFSAVFSPNRFTFTVGANQVIPGLDEGVQGMRLGGRRQLVIPTSLGYGENGSPGGFPVPNEPIVMTVDAVMLQ
jgi:FKBP-type peptidyl-prolyl cis-trans isomerase